MFVGFVVIVVVVVVVVVAIDFLKELKLKSQVQGPCLTGLRHRYESWVKESERPPRMSPVDDARRLIGKFLESARQQVLKCCCCCCYFLF